MSLNIGHFRAWRPFKLCPYKKKKVYLLGIRHHHLPFRFKNLAPSLARHILVFPDFQTEEKVCRHNTRRLATTFVVNLISTNEKNWQFDASHWHWIRIDASHFVSRTVLERPLIWKYWWIGKWFHLALLKQRKLPHAPLPLRINLNVPVIVSSLHICWNASS